MSAPSTMEETAPMEVGGNGLAGLDVAEDVLLSIPKSPVVVLVIGMAGSGKSTWMHRLVMRLTSQQKRIYTVNLDPAVRNVAYPLNIDIRDTVNAVK
mmetsp:Transcript_53087/g.98198  ORF Transcript_53087/g.98198 Transcript_53087/m.98198 type:complete len:97 (-) Transcript_53087:3-293(-)